MKKILVVDDDQDILLAVQLILETSGYNPAITTKGDETYTKINEFKPDLILLDLLLSGNDGRHICKNLKSNEITKKIPIIMMSAHPSAKNSALLYGADGFVAKPFSIDQILNEIEKFLNPPKVNLL